MTEKEAKRKWCPMSRNEIADHCLGSDCMMWRVTDNEWQPEPPMSASLAKSLPAGYCGLGGKP